MQLTNLDFIKSVKYDMLMAAKSSVMQSASLLVKSLMLLEQDTELRELVNNMQRELVREIDDLHEYETMVEYRIIEKEKYITEEEYINENL